MPKTTFIEAERQMRREQDRQRTREAVEALRASEGWQNWLRLRHYFHDFSLTNQLLIAVSMPEATRVAGFRTWLKLGHSVRRGEQARIRVWVPMVPSKKRLTEWEAAGAKPADRPRVWFRLAPVWDRSQVEPLPPPAVPVALDPPIAALEGDSLAWVFPRLVALTSELGCSLVIERHPDGRGGCFMPELRIISLNEANPVNHQVKTFVHELAHALLRHTTELDEITLTYSQEELVVESIALSVVAGLGIDSSGYSVPYIASWSENAASMEIVEKCAGLIDRLAKRIEDTVHRAPQTAAAEQTAA